MLRTRARITWSILVVQASSPAWLGAGQRPAPQYENDQLIYAQLLSAGEDRRGRRRTPAVVQTRARQLRHEMTPAEAKLWECLRNHQLDGYKFRRQHPIGRFIVDFYCPEQKRVVAIDGPVHHEQTDRDEERTQVLQASGYRVYHWTNEQVEQNLANEPQPVSNVTSVESMTRPVLGSTESESRRRADLAIRLLDEWMADESGYDEETWPELKAALDVKSCRTWNDPLEDAVMTNKAARLI